MTKNLCRKTFFFSYSFGKLQKAYTLYLNRETFLGLERWLLRGSSGCCAGRKTSVQIPSTHTHTQPCGCVFLYSRHWAEGKTRGLLGPSLAASSTGTSNSGFGKTLSQGNKAGGNRAGHLLLPWWTWVWGCTRARTHVCVCTRTYRNLSFRPVPNKGLLQSQDSLDGWVWNLRSQAVSFCSDPRSHRNAAEKQWLRSQAISGCPSFWDSNACSNWRTPRTSLYLECQVFWH